MRTQQQQPHLQPQQQQQKDYNMATTSSIKSHVLRAGECVILPKDAVITSIVINGSITATSDCTLPTPETYKCGYFFLILDADANTGHSMDDDTSYVSVTVGGNTYMINELVTSGGDTPSPTTETGLNLHIPDLAIFEFTAVTENEVTSRVHLHVYFKTPESLFDTVKLKVDNRGVGSFQIYEPIEAECDEFPEPE